MISLPSNMWGAVKKAKKADSATVFRQAQEAFMDYEFDEATDLLEEYFSMQTKAKKPLDESYESLARQITTATNAFGRVQKIVVIDSINMPRSSFFDALNLAKSAGSVRRASDFNLPLDSVGTEMAFLSEGKDYFITSVNDEDDNLKLVEYRKLLDGSWEETDALEGDFDKDGDYAFPFLSGDGQTLYFGNNGEDSMGEYDIFVAMKEPITGESRQPLNMGMPFNSPYNDFMMAIDEETGIGWWATDRNSPGEDVTIYVYLLDETRKNYAPDTEDLKSFAKISDYKATWEEGKESYYQSLLKSLQK